ncbi:MULTISPECIES: hypothetical protein [unclassified Streptomyces]|uniref:hypothetical protein n=1 Tax=unclassified Streptomyces TaxID=2593676 RepID=UPI00344F4F6B
MCDMRLTWCVRGVLAELATGYSPGQEPTISELASLTREECLTAEGREAFRKAVSALRAPGCPTPDAATTRTSVGEGLVVDFRPAVGARLIPQCYGHSSITDGS